MVVVEDAYPFDHIRCRNFLVADEEQVLSVLKVSGLAEVVRTGPHAGVRCVEIDYQKLVVQIWPDAGVRFDLKRRRHVFVEASEIDGCSVAIGLMNGDTGVVVGNAVGETGLLVAASTASVTAPPVMLRKARE